MVSKHYVRWFSELGLEDVAVVGGKNASLGELYCALNPLGVPVPNGFALTAEAFRDCLTEADAWGRLHRLLDGLDKNDVGALQRAGAEARDIVYAATRTEWLRQEVVSAWQQLQAEYGPDLSVAVRSSATAEDLPDASFAGQHESFLNIRGEEMLFDACRRCLASIFTDRAISYRIDKGFDHFKVALSVGVMKMVRSDLAASGVMFTLDTESGFRDVVFVTAAYGLGENVVQGTVDPDEFYVHKPMLMSGHRAVLRRRLGEKQIKMVYATGRTRDPSRNVPTPPEARERFCIDDADVLTLADHAVKIEDHYSRRAGKPMPMDVEWAKDGLDGRLYIVQARPETVVSQSSGTVIREYRLTGRSAVLTSGRAVGAAIASGPVRVAADARHLAEFRTGEVLVADTTAPDWEPVMKRAAAIVTNRGGRTCHAAIIARELGIPAVVGAEAATTRLENGQLVTVSCAEGDAGRIYEGQVTFETTEIDASTLPRPVTEIMVNLGNPELAFKIGRMPTDGVGLARMEFIISEHVKAHPMALLHPEKITRPEVRAAIETLTRHHESGSAFFVQALSEGIGTIAAAFWPRPVIVRLSDFKTNEYASLLGGQDFEPVEANPMLGFRGAARYSHPAYAEGFGLECAALRRVRGEMGLRNVKVMVPFCRTEREARLVVDTLAANGLERGVDGLELYLMCEIPNNVVRIDGFAALFDGFSIGSNDLTQLVLGVDRDSEIVAFDFDERDPGVLEMLRLAIQGAKRNGRHIGICGQAPSDHPEVAEFLVREGIDSLSLNPDSVLSTTRRILDLERQLGRAARTSEGRSPALPG